jgi:hypothetical protein
MCTVYVVTRFEKRKQQPQQQQHQSQTAAAAAQPRRTDSSPGENAFASYFFFCVCV